MSSQTLTIVYNTSRYLYRFRRELITALQETGLEIAALVPDAEYESKLAEISVPIAKIRLRSHSLNPLSDITTYRDIKKKLKEYRPDVVFNFTIKPTIYGSLAAHQHGVREIYSMMPGLGYIFSDTNVWNFPVRLLVLNLYRIALKHNRRVFFQNLDDYEFFARKGIISRKQGVVISGSGIDLKKFSNSSPPDSFPTFFMATRMLKHKGVTEFIETARIMNSEGSVARFVLAGPLEKSRAAVSRDYIYRSVEEGVVEYLGELKDVRPWISRSWAVVLPSYYREGTPRILLEALGMGRPVVTTNLPGCRDAVIEGQNGYLVPPNDTGALVNALRRLTKGQALVEEMGQVSRAIAENRYDVRMITNQILTAMGREYGPIGAGHICPDGGWVPV